MPRRGQKPEEIVDKLREVDVLVSQGHSVANALRGAVSASTTSAIYFTVAADHMFSAGGVAGVPVTGTPVLDYICYGRVGLAGLLTGRGKAMIGLPVLLRLLMLAGALSVALVARMPNSWVGLILSAGLQGVHVIMTSAGSAAQSPCP